MRQVEGPASVRRLDASPPCAPADSAHYHVDPVLGHTCESEADPSRCTAPAGCTLVSMTDCRSWTAVQTACKCTCNFGGPPLAPPPPPPSPPPSVFISSTCGTETSAWCTAYADSPIPKGVMIMDESVGQKKFCTFIKYDTQPCDHNQHQVVCSCPPAEPGKCWGRQIEFDLSGAIIYDVCRNDVSCDLGCTGSETESFVLQDAQYPRYSWSSTGCSCPIPPLNINPRSPPVPPMLPPSPPPTTTRASKAPSEASAAITSAPTISSNELRQLGRR